MSVEIKESYRAAFTALMELAKYPGGLANLDDSCNTGRYQREQEILAVIDKIELERDPKYSSEDRWDQPTIDELRRRIEEKV